MSSRRRLPFVDSGRRDPNRAIFVADRDIAARGGRHPIAVDPLHRLNDFVARMDEMLANGHGATIDSVWPKGVRHIFRHRPRLLFLPRRAENEPDPGLSPVLTPSWIFANEEKIAAIVAGQCAEFWPLAFQPRAIVVQHLRGDDAVVRLLCARKSSRLCANGE